MYCGVNEGEWKDKQKVQNKTWRRPAPGVQPNHHNIWQSVQYVMTISSARSVGIVIDSALCIIFLFPESNKFIDYTHNFDLSLISPLPHLHIQYGREIKVGNFLVRWCSMMQQAIARGHNNTELLLQILCTVSRIFTPKGANTRFLGTIDTQPRVFQRFSRRYVMMQIVEPTPCETVQQSSREQYPFYRPSAIEFSIILGILFTTILAAEELLLESLKSGHYKRSSAI